MLKMQSVKRSTWLPLGIGLSGLYGITMVVVLLAANWGKDGFAWNTFESGLAGALVPVVIVWAVAGFVTQYYQLQLQRDQLQEQGQVLRDQAQEIKETRAVFLDQLKIQTRQVDEVTRYNNLHEKTFLDQLRAQSRQVEEATRQNNLREKALMMQAMPKYLEFLDDLAREIRDANRVPGSENQKAILNLIEYLDGLDFYHGTKEKQILIQGLGQNANFMRFCRELDWFEKLVEQFHVGFMVDRAYQLDRLNANLERFEGYKLVVVARSMSSR